MPATTSRVSDMLVTVKSREVQRALFTESSRNREAARRHFLDADAGKGDADRFRKQKRLNRPRPLFLPGRGGR